MKILMAMTLALLVGCDGEAYKEWSKEREARKEAERVQAERVQAERDARLRYGHGSGAGWKYLNDGDVQYAILDSNMWLRKVKSDDHDEDSLNALAYWKVGCDEGLEIETSLTYSAGDAKLLRCTSAAGETWLSHGSGWDLDEPVRWNEDLDGFSVSEDFRDWDWSKSRQYATLQMAKMPEPEQEPAE